MLFEKGKIIFLIGFGKFRFQFQALVTLRSSNFGRSTVISVFAALCLISTKLRGEVNPQPAGQICTRTTLAKKDSRMFSLVLRALKIKCVKVFQMTNRCSRSKFA